MDAPSRRLLTLSVVRSRRRPPLALVAFGVGLLVEGAGCASLRAGRAGKAPDVAGIWEGVSRTTVAEGVGTGDTKLERQAWSLRQKGDRIDGFYVVELTMISGDGRPYLCSGTPRFTTMLRFEIRGRAARDGIDLQEIGDVRARGACRPSFHSPTRYRADLNGDVLTVGAGDARTVLYRRSRREAGEVAAALLAFERPDQTWQPGHSFPSLGGGTAAPADVRGLWVWEARATLPGGDQKHEREEWHLTQEGDRVTGYYDRAVRQVSTDGNAYRCSNSPEFQVVTRYQVSGEVRGQRLVLFERGFEILERSPCDNGQRRLDSYEGQAAGGELHLEWGVGRQVLRRARVPVPSERF